MSYPLDPWDDFECVLNSYERAIGNLHYSEAIDRASYVATPVMSDGCDGPSLELRGLFEQFLREVS